MSKYLELVEVSEGVIVLRRSDNKNSPLVKIEFSEEVKKLLNGMEFDVAKEMIKSGIESLNADINLDNLDEDLFENICLLYTSPSPRDRTRSRMPSSA